MKILVTGGAGFIGSHLCRALVSGGYDVRALDTLSEQVHGEESVSVDLGGAELIAGDVRDAELVRKLVSDAEAVVHLAAETGTGQSMHEIDRYTSTNVGGTATLLDAIVSAPRRTSRFILASSRAVYGEGSYSCPNDGDVYPEARRLEDLRLGRFDLRCPICGGSIESKPTAESAPLRPASVYAVTKQTQEELVRVTCTSAEVDWLTLRFQNVFGPDQSLNNPYTGILSIFSALLLAGSPVEIYEDGIESRDFVFVSDAVGALVRAIESSVSGLALNIGSGEATSVLQVATLLSAAFESPSAIEISGRFRVGDIRHNVADLTSAQRELGYRPRTTLADGIREFTRWATSQPRPQSRYADSLAELERLGLSGGSEGKL